MSDQADLRELLRPQVGALKDAGTWPDLPRICETLGLPWRSAESKRLSMLASFDALPEEELPAFAERLLARHPPSASVRNSIQDLLWRRSPAPEIPKRVRREIARALAGEELFQDPARFDALLDDLWVLDRDGDPFAGLFGGHDTSLRAQIERHVHRNPDWSVEELFDKLGAYDATDRRFALFLEGLASGDVRQDEASQRRFVGVVNDVLRQCGVELRETGIDGGYPVFSLVSLHAGTAGRPKNLIFASSVKPDLRFRDAVNNDIEIVTNADKVLVYDRPIGMDGLRWRDLQQWWSETMGVADQQQAKATLYRRLRSCLPPSSPPQRLLFEEFFRVFGSAVPDLPALLPEVWLHWDPKTVRQRGSQALLGFRMDFLMLLPGGVRVVLEVDGRQHYGDDGGQADPARYGQMVAADRDLKLAGYEVFRFGGAELNDESGRKLVDGFFRALFRRYRIGVPTGP